MGTVADADLDEDPTDDDPGTWATVDPATNRIVEETGVPQRAPCRTPLVSNGYHVSRQNTQTGRLTAAMFDAALASALALARAR